MQIFITLTYGTSLETVSERILKINLHLMKLWSCTVPVICYFWDTVYTSKLQQQSWIIKTEHLTYVEVIVRNRSCPAVSQICSFTLSPSISNVRILKSTPIVVIYVPTITRKYKQQWKQTEKLHINKAKFLQIALLYAINREKCDTCN